MDAANLLQQTLESPPSKALKGLSIAREYKSYGFTTLRDLGSADPECRPLTFATRSTRDSWQDLGSSWQRGIEHQRIVRPALGIVKGHRDAPQ